VKLPIINRYLGLLLIVLTATVSIPLTITTISTDGGSWGFGIIGLAILFPLNALGLFGFTALLHRLDRQRKAFVASHIISVLVGLTSLLSFPIYPAGIVAVPLSMTMLGIASRRRTSHYLFVMIVLAVASNLVLLKWELDFHRNLPLLQLFA
jgi:hypothetical protein